MFFCKQVAETSKYIFVGCDFTQKAWADLLSGMTTLVPSNIELVNLFSNWQLRYPRTSSTSHELRKIWQAIPKFFWWKIWLARNDLIFNSKVMKPGLVAIKAKAMLSEVVGKIHLDPDIIKVEHKWLGLIQMDKIQLSIRRPIIIPFWQVIRLEKYFTDWWKRKNKVSIFFDGASKGNPGKSRERWSRKIDLLSRRKA